MTEEAAAKAELPKITHLETNTIRDLLVMGVPEPWANLDSDDHIRARAAQEVMMMMIAGPPVLAEISGKVRRRPTVWGIVRDIDVRLVRKPEDLEGLVVEHDDCSECVDTIEALRKGDELPMPVMAVVQFTYDEVVGAS